MLAALKSLSHMPDINSTDLEMLTRLSRYSAQWNRWKNILLNALRRIYPVDDRINKVIGYIQRLWKEIPSVMYLHYHCVNRLKHV